MFSMYGLVREAALCGLALCARHTPHFSDRDVHSVPDSAGFALGADLERFVQILVIKPSNGGRYE